jgi:predicted thioredoxin/glutaredoxin
MDCYITIDDSEIESIVDGALDSQLADLVHGRIEELLDDFIVSSSCSVARKFEDAVVGIIEHHAERAPGATEAAARRGLLQALRTATTALEREGVSTR